MNGNVAAALAVQVAVDVVVRLVIVTESTADVFLTVTEKEALPPGSGSEVGSAVFVTRIELARSVIVTVASSWPETGLPSSSVPEAVTTSVWSCRRYPRPRP